MNLFSSRLREEIRQTIRLSVPIMIAQLGVILMGITDNLLVGRLLGKIPLGAVGLANSIAFLISCLGVGTMTVIAPMVSKANSEQNYSACNRIFRASLWVAGILSLVLCSISVVVASNFWVFKQQAEQSQLASNFMLIITASNIPMFFFIASKQLTDGLSHTKVAMQITVSALVLNALLNWCLIQGIWGFPKLGLMGSATATLIARVFMLIAILMYIYRSQLFAHIVRLKLPSLNFVDSNFRLVFKIFRLGLPGGFQFFFEIAAFSTAIVLMGWLGEDRLAAHQIAINMASATYLMATGISVAGGIRVGQGLGLKDLSAIRTSGNAAFLLVLAFMGFWCLIFLIFPNFLVSLYIKDAEVANIAVTLMMIAGLFQLSDGVQVVALGLLRGIADVNIPTAITLFAYWVAGLPVGYYLGFVQGFDAEGVWIGLSAGLTVSAVFLTLRFYRILGKMELRSCLS